MKTTVTINTEIVKEIEFLAEFLSSREGQPVTTDDVIDTLIRGDCKLPEQPPLYSHSRQTTGTREASKRHLEVNLYPDTYQRITELQNSLRETAERVNPYADVDYSTGNLIYGLIKGTYTYPTGTEDSSQSPEDTYQSPAGPSPTRKLWEAPGRLPSD
ncbi:MAG: hypothetical protein N0E59_19560 [Candidatus Thiodiazotropha taylori]|nr:hypothetical protein [Candidatus Thiodiazotropha taylori]MCG8097346.1 hypothetical protein [Candidatus Thiodiazotropha endolucinida]MCG8108863.1 hypothetical protein [Candidatus Thiodiazotropha taylori]MCG8112955.1 hypothetical protein [Candidatus Thiodiazotropha taylori]MCW4281199.1 hypothetical protein [Candidatus Thiodiazotropha taylori]